MQVKFLKTFLGVTNTRIRKSERGWGIYQE
jgi:hypothetical protein